MTERISCANKDGYAAVGSISILDRVLGAALAFFGVALTLALAPVILAVGLPKLIVFQHPFFSWPLSGLFFWSVLWVIPATIAGWIAGFPNVLNLFSHLWFTAEPPDKRLSRKLWCGILVVVVFTGFAGWPL